MGAVGMKMGFSLHFTRKITFTPLLHIFMEEYTVNETSDVAIDLSGKLIEICVKTLIARNIAQVGNFIKAILKC